MSEASSSAALEAPVTPAAPPAAAPPAGSPAPGGDVAAHVQAQVDANAGKANVPIAWLGEVDADTAGYVQNKGWTDAKQVLEGYRALEKMRGVPADRLLTLPAADADEATRGAFYDKLGRPKAAADYDFKIGDEATTGKLKELVHKHGLSADQARGLINDWAAHEATGLEAAGKAAGDRIHADNAKLAAEWGAAHDQNMAAARQGRDVLGWDAKTIDAVGATIGHYNLVKLLHSVAERSGEASFVAGSTPGSGNQNFKMTPEQAGNELKRLRSDASWVKRYASGDAATVAEVRRLNSFISAGR